MIAYLEGRLAFKSPALLHLDVNGIGYEVNISLHTYSAIQSLEKVKLYTYLQVKEDAHTLYGFFEPQEKEIFVLLISVSGVGAATARMMLSSLKPKEIVVAILVGNSKALEAIKGIGKKTALRLVMHLLQKDEKDTQIIATAILKMRNEIKFCKTCHNVSDYDICSICNNSYRDKSVVCIVENFRDIIAIENTRHYNGLYHVLGGVISPLDGVGPDQLTIEPLLNRLKTDEVEELIFALSPNIQGDTTLFYISKKIKDLPVKITTISRGIAFGGELEYADELTLARSLQNRQPVANYVSMK